MDYSNLTLDGFYNLIFDPEDWTCFGNKVQETGVTPHNSPFGRTKKWFAINPLDSKFDRCPTEGWHKQDKPRRAKCNVTKFRNIMIEQDSCPIPDQKAHIKAVRFPYSTCVYSGGKSLHFIVSLETPLANETEYRCWWKAIFKIFSDNGASLDPATVNPACFSRCPNAFREDKGQTQHLLKLNSRVKNSDMMAWFASHGVNPSDFRPQVVYEDIAAADLRLPSTATDAQRFEVAKAFMKDDACVKGNINNFQFKIACVCKAVGLSETTATEFIRQHFGPIDKRGAISSAYTRSVVPIRVKTTEEWLEEKMAADYDAYLRETEDKTPMTLGEFKCYSKTKWRITKSKI
jgi:hypothetical protein